MILQGFGQFDSGGRTCFANPVEPYMSLIITDMAACRGYWKDVRNVRQELEHWLQVHPLKTPELLPSQSQLRRTGSSSLAFAITKHGGYAKLFAG